MPSARPAFTFLALTLLSAPALAAPPVCIDSYRIDTTETPDDSTILFKMRDHSVYRAHLVDRCVGLTNDTRGFTYEPIPGSEEICANLLTIRLNTYHSVCLVGAIEKIRPAR